MTAERKAWTREELLVVLEFYCITPFGKYYSTNRDIQRLAELIGRSASSVAMKLSNFASFDPAHSERGVRGLANASQLDRAVWDEFHADWTSAAVEADRARSNWAGGPTERTREQTVRIAQTFFRMTLRASYRDTCAVCQLTGLPGFLIASHIIPWAVEPERRADPTNGLLLCPQHDRAFDRGYLSVTDDYQLLVSLRFSSGKPEPLIKAQFTSFESQPLHLPDHFLPDPAALAYHRQHVFKFL